MTFLLTNRVNEYADADPVRDPILINAAFITEATVIRTKGQGGAAWAFLGLRPHEASVQHVLAVTEHGDVLQPAAAALQSDEDLLRAFKDATS